MSSFFHAPFRLSSSRSFYIIHHTGFLDSFLNSPDHDLQDCDIDRHLLPSAIMAETTPLLPRPKRPLHEHCIFQRVCHSPWYFKGQRSLLFMRAFFALYMTAALASGIVQESRSEHRARARFLPFDASTISFVIQTIYYWITAVRIPFQPGRSPTS